MPHQKSCGRHPGLSHTCSLVCSVLMSVRPASAVPSHSLLVKIYSVSKREIKGTHISPLCRHHIKITLWLTDRLIVICKHVTEGKVQRHSCTSQKWHFHILSNRNRVDHMMDADSKRASATQMRSTNNGNSVRVKMIRKPCPPQGQLANI